MNRTPDPLISIINLMMEKDEHSNLVDLEPGKGGCLGDSTMRTTTAATNALKAIAVVGVFVRRSSQFQN
jgi:hypothetical protein